MTDKQQNRVETEINLLTVIFYMNLSRPDGYTQRDLADESGYSLRTVKKYLKVLTDEGVIKRRDNGYSWQAPYRGQQNTDICLSLAPGGIVGLSVLERRDLVRKKIDMEFPQFAGMTDKERDAFILSDSELKHATDELGKINRQMSGHIPRAIETLNEFGMSSLADRLERILALTGNERDKHMGEVADVLELLHGYLMGIIGEISNERIDSDVPQ